MQLANQTSKISIHRNQDALLLIRSNDLTIVFKVNYGFILTFLIVLLPDKKSAFFKPFAVYNFLFFYQ